MKNRNYYASNTGYVDFISFDSLPDKRYTGISNLSSRILEIPENKLVSGTDYEVSCWYYSNTAEELFNILKIQQKGPDSLITIQSRNTNSMPNTDGKKTIARMEFKINDVTKRTIISIESSDKLAKNKSTKKK